MTTSTEMLTTLRAKLKLYEGNVKHFYLDTKGKVTIGVGHMLAHKNDTSGIILYKTHEGKLTKAATLAEKMAEFDVISKRPWGKRYLYKSFEPYTTLVMKQTDIDFLLNKHIDSFYTELKSLYQKHKGYADDFDNFDTNLKLALFDMIFNLGATKLRKSFPKFNAALKSEDFETAAKESHRLDIDHTRNEYVNDLISNLVVEA